MKHFYKKINGWFTFPNLYKKVVQRQVSEAHFVEIGSCFGQSACYMAVEILNSKKNIKFDCIDLWQNDIRYNINNKDNWTNDNVYNEFLQNTETVRSVINPIRLPSVEGSKLYTDNSLDFVFIDANHDYEFVKDDIKVWYPKVKKDGILAGHDYNIKDWPGVVKAVDEFISENNYKLEIKSEQCWGIIK